MMIRKPDDNTLVQSTRVYFESGIVDEFIKIGGMWIMENARLRYKLDEDDVSDLFIIFHGRAQRCLEIFKAGGYSNFPAFLNVYNKHLVFNFFKTHKIKRNEHYICLWDEGKRLKLDTEEEFELLDITLEMLSELAVLNRLVVCLKHNVKFSESDFYVLAQILKNNPNYPLDLFIKDYKRRLEKIKKEKEYILAKINRYNRRIFYKQENIEFSIRKSKRKLFKRFFKCNEIYSLKEIGRILSLSGRRANKIYKDSIQNLKYRVTELSKWNEETQTPLAV
ncbi:MAG: hypothetical protein H7A23_04195 [Leptospiraceae bacterium]|nr:hypothetical protein [Leptospiraceae bacterium]